jgi:hypothetical protein
MFICISHGTGMMEIMLWSKRPRVPQAGYGHDKVFDKMLGISM